MIKQIDSIKSKCDVVLETDLDELLRGAIIVLPDLLQLADFYDKFVLTAVEVIRDEVSPAVARQVVKAGFERLHEFVPPFLLPELISVMGTRLNIFAEGLLHAVSTRFRPMPSRLFLADHTWVRIMMPEDLISDYKESLVGQYGHALVHNPHRDSWFSQATNAVNLWIAVGRVRRGNSVLIYPEVLGRALKRDGKSVARSQRLGIPLNFALNAGDALLFIGEHLHSTEVNTTQETRLVVSLRFTAEPPKYRSVKNRTFYREILIRQRDSAP